MPTPTSLSAVFAALAASTLTFTAPVTFADDKPSSPSVRSSAVKKELKSKSLSYSIYAAGDIADCRNAPAEQTMAAQTAAIIESGLASDKNAYAVTLGDNTYPIGKPEEFRECYDKTWGKFKARTLPSPGNHDYGVPLAAGYYNYFDELAGVERRGYYQKNLGSWLLLSLNSNLKGQAMQTQIAWLKNILKQDNHSCILAFWHHPVISSGGHGNLRVMQDVWAMLAKAKADIILSSHDHHYERFAALDAQGMPDPQNGMRSFVVGTGGAKLSPIFLIKNGSEVRQNEQHGVLKLQLHARSYQWEFLAANTHTVLDQGQGNCH